MVSLILTLCCLYTVSGVKKQITHERMLAYSAASARATDGAENRVVMNGISGSFGYSVYMAYLEDGYISLRGSHLDDSNAWKLLSKFTLEPGTYTLTGMRGVEKDTIALQLHFADDTGFYRYLYQFDEDVVFTIDRLSEATLHVMVYPNAEGIDVIARPAVFRDE